MSSRRRFIQAALVAGSATVATPGLLSSRAAAADIDPTTIPKYVTPLFVTPAMPRVSQSGGRDIYSVAARRISQQILPRGLPATTVFAFGSTTSGSSFRTPGYTLEAPVSREAQVTWRNQLRNPFTGNFLPPLVAVDPTLHWANPPGGVEGRDSMPDFTSTPGPYTGPVPLTVHFHGGRQFEESDGYPESWFLPAAANIPAGYARVGSFYDPFRAEAADRWGVQWRSGTAVFVYPSDQRATTLWYHDHSLGITRTNVYAGLVGLATLRGGPSDLPAGVLPGPPPRPGDPPGRKYYEIPLVVQDKSFADNGALSFPDSRGDFGDTTGPYVPDTDIHPIWNPLFLGDTTVVNGNTWPFLQVEPRRYRFRLLNACDILPLNLKVVSDPAAPRPAPAALPIWVIGSDGGFLPVPVSLNLLAINTAERYDVIIDFTGLQPGTRLFLSNESPAAPPATTGQVLRFDVVPLTSPDTSTPPDQLDLPGFRPIGPETNVRQVSMNELRSADQPTVIREMTMGTVNADGTPNPLGWGDPLTEEPAFGSTEIWELHNFAPGGHSIHIHLVQFQVLDRISMSTGVVTPPQPFETGDKDTVFAPAGLITRVKANFDLRSRYVWHCHFLSHEDNDMMRPFVVR